jgi:hypothetical protein
LREQRLDLIKELDFNEVIKTFQIFDSKILHLMSEWEKDLLFLLIVKVKWDMERKGLRLFGTSGECWYERHY